MPILFVWLIINSHSVAFAVPGCPFCGPTGPTYCQRLADCDVALKVSWVSLEINEQEQSESTQFTINEIVRNGNPPFKIDDKVEIPFARDGKPGDPFLILAKRDEDSWTWELPIELNDERYAYIQQAPPPEKPDRLLFFLKSLEYSDTEIAADAFAEFSRAEFKDVKRLAPKMNREHLRRWVSSDDQAKQVRLGLYGMMLGLSGDDTDAAFLKSLILTLPDPDRPRFGIDGMMAGYILLKGEKGLQTLLENKFGDPKAADDLLPLRNAIVFIWDYGKDRVPEESLRTALRQYLDHEQYATSILRDLSRWKDWSSLERLTKQFG
ncbi:MAG: hypothetical protein FJ267_10465, partial [Planctomycetes bacterium]|nr:hypothetical protein [Planctomycetota bacterium]